MLINVSVTCSVFAAVRSVPSAASVAHVNDSNLMTTQYELIVFLITSRSLGQ